MKSSELSNIRENKVMYIFLYTKAALPVAVLALLSDRGAAQAKVVWKQSWTTWTSVGDGHQRLRRPHGRWRFRLNGLLPGTLMKNLYHGVLLNNLGMEVLYPAFKEENRLFYIRMIWGSNVTAAPNKEILMKQSALNIFFNNNLFWFWCDIFVLFFHKTTQFFTIRQ